MSQATVQTACTWSPYTYCITCHWIMYPSLSPAQALWSAHCACRGHSGVLFWNTLLCQYGIHVSDVPKTLQDSSSLMLKEPIRVTGSSMSCVTEVTVEMWNVCERDGRVCKWDLLCRLICQCPDRQQKNEDVAGILKGLRCDSHRLNNPYCTYI